MRRVQKIERKFQTQEKRRAEQSREEGREEKKVEIKEIDQIGEKESEKRRRINIAYEDKNKKPN